jgi:hypothetical protein
MAQVEFTAIRVVETPLTNLDAAFLKAMDAVGQYGLDKYGEKSIQHRLNRGDRSRIEGERYTREAMAQHASEHFQMYLRGELHDHFGTVEMQLAAVAFNAMMEFMFYRLEVESGRN